MPACEYITDITMNGEQGLGHEIVILHKLVTQMSTRLEDLQQERCRDKDDVVMLLKQNDEQQCINKKMIDLFLQLFDENAAIVHDLKMVYEAAQHTVDTVTDHVDFSVVLEESTNTDTDSTRSSFGDSSTGSPLTKKQKISRKKRDWAKRKCRGQRIASFRDRWTQENGYNVEGLGLAFI